MNQSDLKQNVTLKPSPRLAILIIVLSLLILPGPFHPFPSILTGIFGLFLLVQTFILRVELTSEALVVWQLNRELRRFPFGDWLAWRIFLPWLPGILYFREKASPHLLPILFEPESLKNQLRLRVGSLEKPKVEPIQDS